MFTVWIGEKMTDKGVGNGLSLLVFIGILSSISTALVDTIGSAFASTENLDELWNILILLVAVIVGLVSSFIKHIKNKKFEKKLKKIR